MASTMQSVGQLLWKERNPSLPHPGHAVMSLPYRTPGGAIHDKSICLSPAHLVAHVVGDQGMFYGCNASIHHI